MPTMTPARNSGSTTAGSTLTIQPIVRIFIHKGMRLPDALPGRSTKQVRAAHALLYADIANAKIEGPELVGNEERYTYRPQVGTNG